MLDPDRDRQEAERLLDDFALSGRELADGVVLIRAGQGTTLRRAYLLPNDLVTFATGPEVQANGPRVKAFRGEEALLGKFLEVSEPRKIRVCYTQGHGEPAFDDLEPFHGYAHLRDLLRTANLDTQVVDFATPDPLHECDLLLVAGPQGSFERVEVDAITAYTEAGGDLLLLTGAVFMRGRAQLAPHGLEALTALYGVRFGERVVIDPSGMAGASDDYAFTLDQGWADHPAVRSLNMQPVSFMSARELSISQPAEMLLGTTERGWAEADLQRIATGGVPTFDGRDDRRGPIPVVVASERGGSRLAVVGSDEFVLNAWLREDIAYDHGRDLILNLVGWLTQRESLLGIREREREHIKLVLQEQQLARMTFLCLVGLPGFAVGVGLLVLWRRRK